MNDPETILASAISKLWASLPLIFSFLALLVSLLNARVPKIDAEYNICLSSLKARKDLWQEYNCPPQENDNTERLLLKILNNAEWAFIYINCRHFILKSDPIKHLEDEILEPFVKCFKQNDEGSDYLKRLMEEHKTGKKTFTALKCGLRRKGVKI